MRYVTKSEGCHELGIALSTLDRRIKNGHVTVKREGRRVYVAVLDLDRSGDESDTPPRDVDDVSIDVALERAHGLENLVSHLQAQLSLEQARYAELLNDVRAGRLALPSPARGPWWKTWRRS